MYVAKVMGGVWNSIVVWYVAKVMGGVWNYIVVWYVAKVMGGVCHYRQSSNFLATGFQDERVQHQIRYEEIIKDKKTLNMLSVRVVNLGIPRSGKTTFWRRMVDPSAEMKEAEPSTGIMDKQKPVVINGVKTDTGILTKSDWLLLDTIGDYARWLMEILPKAQGVSVLGGSPDTPGKATDTTLASLPSESDIFKSLFMKAIESDSDWETVKDKFEDMILLNTADTGGHAEFLDMHAALINGPSIYLFFTRLTDKLDEPFKVYYTDENSKSTIVEDSDSTVIEVIFQALSSISCFGNAHTSNASSQGGISAKLQELQEALVSRMSKVMFAGTYGDVVTDGFKDKDAELRQEIEGTDFYGNVMFADNDQLMLKVNNKDGGANEIHKIREILRARIKKFFKSIPIPASWFVLSLLIRDHQSPTMTLNECEVLARDINISPGELQTALWFLHHCLGDILYYPEDALRDIVFCKIQAIYNSITKLIKKTYTVEFVQRDAAVPLFRNLGIFSLNEIERAPEEENSLSRDKLVELLKHLKIITPAPSALLPKNFDMKDPYLMPCMLRNYKGNSLPCSEEDPKPLLLCFQCGFMPMGIFPALINEMVSKWDIHPEGREIFKNRVRFLVGVDVVYLISHLRCLEIAFFPDSSLNLSKSCQRVRKDVERGLQKVTQRMNYKISGCHDYAFWCIKCCNCENHLAVYKEATSKGDARMVCRVNGVPAHLTDHHKVWFQGEPSCKIPSHSDTACMHKASN